MQDSANHEDRFHDPDAVNKLVRETTRKTYMEFAPEPQHFINDREIIKNFTVGNKYEVMSRTEGQFYHGNCNYYIRLVDDTGAERTINEKYFVYSSSNELRFNDEVNDEPMPDLIAARAARADIVDMSPEAISCWSDQNQIKTLAGVRKAEVHDYEVYEAICADTTKPERLGLNDKGNPLLNDLDKLMASVGRVFGGGYSSTDPDSLLSKIGESFPNRTLSWDNDNLLIDGAKTTIKYKDTQDAFNGLKKLLSSAAAERAVAKIVASKLKKLF